MLPTNLYHTKKLQQNSVIAFSVLFILLNAVLISFEQYWFMALPIVLFVSLAAFVALDQLMYVIIFCTPLSIIFQDAKLGVALSLPTEPLLVCVFVIYSIRSVYEKKIERRILFHPITISVVFYLAWIFVSCLTSTMPNVSWKFFLSRLWLIVPFYFVSLQLFKSEENKRKYIWIYISSFSIVIIYTLINHGLEGFTEKAAHLAMVPFYSDHTSYGAMIAMYLPPLILFTFGNHYSTKMRCVSFFFLVLFIVGLLFSYTRAAWLSILCAMVVYIIYVFRIKAIFLVVAGAVVMSIVLYHQADILMALESSKHKNIRNKNIEQRVQSITNVTTDASNTERFNRWACALRMFGEKPIVGWGPGTYQFQYAPFQIQSEKTIISTNFGDVGNAHSEYLGPLAEGGLIGLLSFLAIIITVLFTSAKIIYRSADKKSRALAIAITLSLITYFIHGTLNDFLDTDKACVPFWGFIALLVLLDTEEKTSTITMK
jgi:O-antigen ligase